MSYSCENNRSILIMRIMNGIANLLFIIYNFTCKAYGNIYANAFILGMNIYFIKKTLRKMKEENDLL